MRGTNGFAKSEIVTCLDFQNLEEGWLDLEEENTTNHDKRTLPTMMRNWCQTSMRGPQIEMRKEVCQGGEKIPPDQQPLIRRLATIHCQLSLERPVRMEGKICLDRCPIVTNRHHCR